MKDYKHTPFELATLAAIIALLNPQNRQSYSSLLNSAHNLLEAAYEFRPLPTVAEKLEQWRQTHPGRVYDLRDILKEQTPPTGKRNKGKTMVGSITTRKGLVKAIRRLFTPAEANVILTNGVILKCEIEKIVKDQSRRNKVKK